jgi:hypothetical protein
MRPPKRAKVQDICRNINERVRVANSFRVLAESYSLNEDGFKENLKQAEIIEGQVEVMRNTLYALFGHAVIDPILEETNKNGEIEAPHT